MLLIILISLLSLCSSRIVHLDESAYLTIFPKESLEFYVDSNPTTGYVWHLAPPSSSNLAVVGDNAGVYVPPLVPMPGYPGKQIFKIKCNNCKPGEAYKMTLGLVRGQEDPVQFRVFYVLVLESPTTPANPESK
jgi:predicted secreted protein